MRTTPKKIEVENETTTETLTTPGAWTVQFCASNDAHFYKSLTLFMENAVMKDGWKRTGFFIYIKKDPWKLILLIIYLIS